MVWIWILILRNTLSGASGRLRLLAKLKDYLNLKPAKAIHQSMILPTLTYCGTCTCILQLKLTSTHLKKLSLFHNRAVKTVSTVWATRLWKTFLRLLIVTAGGHVRWYENAMIRIYRYAQFFMIILLYHVDDKKTRNNECLLRLPNIKTEYVRKSFFFMGAKVYNNFPIEICKTKKHEDFENLLEDHF